MTGDRVGDDATRTSLRVIEAVAEERRLEPVDLEPLYEAIDPDGLDSLFPADRSDAERPGPKLSFTFAEQRVTIFDDGVIDLAPAAEPPTERESGPTDS